MSTLLSKRSPPLGHFTGIQCLYSVEAILVIPDGNAPPSSTCKEGVLLLN